MNEGQDAAGVLLRDILYAWRDRNERNAVKEASSLTFWRDGMLEQLNQIADGKATRRTFDELKKAFGESADPVAEALARLVELRAKIINPQIAHQIDKIVNDSRYGKNSIRENIEWIINHHAETDVQVTAIEICKGIEILNAELKALFRIVYGSAR
jgi:hypothetical protein